MLLCPLVSGVDRQGDPSSAVRYFSAFCLRVIGPDSAFTCAMDGLAADTHVDIRLLNVSQ